MDKNIEFVRKLCIDKLSLGAEDGGFNISMLCECASSLNHKVDKKIIPYNMWKSLCEMPESAHKTYFFKWLSKEVEGIAGQKEQNMGRKAVRSLRRVYEICFKESAGLFSYVTDSVLYDLLKVYFVADTRLSSMEQSVRLMLEGLFYLLCDDRLTFETVYNYCLFDNCALANHLMSQLNGEYMEQAEVENKESDDSTGSQTELRELELCV